MKKVTIILLTTFTLLLFHSCGSLYVDDYPTIYRGSYSYYPNRYYYPSTVIVRQQIRHITPPPRINHRTQIIKPQLKPFRTQPIKPFKTQPTPNRRK